MAEKKITKEIEEYYLVTGDDRHTLEVYMHEKRKLNTIKKNGYFTWYMPGYQDVKERYPSKGYWAKSNVVKIEKITRTIFTETEEIQ